jgi:hypothetical protein
MAVSVHAAVDTDATRPNGSSWSPIDRLGASHSRSRGCGLGGSSLPFAPVQRDTRMRPDLRHERQLTLTYPFRSSIGVEAAWLSLLRCQASSLEQDGQQPPGLQFGLQFTLVQASSLKHTHKV